MNYLVTFADSRMLRSLKRISDQAKSLNYFDGIYAYTQADLPCSFTKYFADKLIPGSRGYGYWSWKPEVILLTLNKINHNDCLIYVDAGCHFNIRGRKRLKEYFMHLSQEKNGIVAFQSLQPTSENSSLFYDGRPLFDQPNYRWIKGDLLDYFHVRHDPTVTNDQVIGATVILIRKCKKAISIVKEWQHIIHEHFNLLDDSPSSSPNLSGFIENRHDQAIWTLICKRNNVSTLSAYEYWYPLNQPGRLRPDWPALDEFPIHAKRDKDLGFILNLIGMIKRIRSRILSLISSVHK